MRPVERALVPIAELGVTMALLAATLALVLATASVVGGQSAPRAPASPAAPGAPRAPRAPASPDGAAAEGLALALLQINAGDRSAEAIVLGLGQSLLAVTEPRAGRAPRPDPGRLAAVLVETLRGRELGGPDRERLAAGLAAALTARTRDGSALAEAGAAVDRAFAQVHEALRAAGLGTPAITLVETELRRLTAGRP